MTVPEELGGGGVSVFDFALAQERLARGDGPTAVAINMHLLTVGIYADLWRSGEESLRLIFGIHRTRPPDMAWGKNDPRMSSAIGMGGLADTTRSAMKVAGGFIINVRSGFGTMSACADFLNETAHYDDPERVSDVWLFMVPTKTPGVTIQNNWDTMSI